MNKEVFLKSVKRHFPEPGDSVVFSCFHDGMFVYEQCSEETTNISDDPENDFKPDIMIEVTFFPKEDATLLDLEIVEDLLNQIDYTKYFDIQVKTSSNSIEDVNIDDINY